MKKIMFLISYSLVSVLCFPAQQESYTVLGFSYQNIYNYAGDFIQQSGGNTGLIGFNSACLVNSV